MIRILCSGLFILGLLVGCSSAPAAPPTSGAATTDAAPTITVYKSPT